MGKPERISIALPDDMLARMRAAVEAGDYPTEDEIVREALREWSDRQDRRQVALERLQVEIDKGLAGPFRDGDDFFEELEAELLAQIESRDAAE